MITNVIKFFSLVKQEFFKITWSDRKQAVSITLMVFVMVFITAMYFFALDWVLSSVVKFLLSLATKF